MRHQRSRHVTGRIVVLAALAVVVAACGGGDDSSASLDQTAWNLTELGDTQLFPGAPATIIFGATDGGSGETFGSTGCNSFSGSYSTEGSSVSIGPLITTLAGCTNPAVQPQEGRYLITLETAETYAISGDALELSDAQGEVTARFEALEPNLGLTSWEALSINNGTGGAQSVVQGTMVTATFDDIGLFSGFGGCNNYSSAYRVGEEYDVVEGGTMQFAGIAAGNKACEADAMAQEDQYFAAIGASTTWIIRGLNLELRSSDGALQVLFARTADG
jgi:heat shock protein HslJ